MDVPNNGAEPTRSARLDFASAKRVLSAINLDPSPNSVPVDGMSGFPQIPGYVFDSVVGRGAGGTVYRVFRIGRSSTTPLALKLLNTAQGGGPFGDTPGSGSSRSRAWRELDALHDLHLPCTPRLLEWGDWQGRLYIVTDLIDGLPLDEHCEKHNLDRRERAALLAAAADAVQMLHENAVIHRDLKPANILVDSRGRPIIIDLGLAKLTAVNNPSLTLTADGSPLGTPAYMSPEQARGERTVHHPPANEGPSSESLSPQCSSSDGEPCISTRSDVYSLGAAAWKVLIGRTPFDLTGRSLAEAVHHVAYDPPREPREIDPTLDRQLAAVLRKACARDARHRYSSAAEFADDLRRWVGNRVVLASRPSFWRVSMEWAARHPVLVTGSACITIGIMTLLATIVSVWWVNQKPYAIEFNREEGNYAYLVARSGRTLHRWGNGRGGCITFAALVNRPAEAGAGGQVVMIGYHNADQPGMCAYDANDPAAELWSSGFDASRFAVPRSETQRTVSSMFVHNASIVDVFPESPGTEVVVVHLDKAGSAAAVRVYTTMGEVLFEAWHCGHLYDTHWLRSEGVLVLTGVNSEGNWASRGYTKVKAPWPTVVLAIKLGFKQQIGWLRSSNEPFELWYRCVLPPDSFEGAHVSATLAAPQSGYGDPDEVVVLQVEDVQLIIDAAGATKRRVVMASQLQKPPMSDGRRPAIERMELGALPPIERPTGSESLLLGE